MLEEQRIQFCSALEVQNDSSAAVAALIEQIHSHCNPVQDSQTFDLAVLFLSDHFRDETGEIAAALQEKLSAKILIGITAEGVIGNAREVEGEAAIAVLAAQLPGVEISPFVFTSVDWPCMLLEPAEFRQIVDAPVDTCAFLLLCDPFSIPIDDVIQAFNLAYPGIPVVGGVASGALRAGGNTLIMNDLLIDGGGIGLALAGNISVEILVSQGCRPIWHPFRVDSAKQNAIYLLDGQAPLAWIQDLAPELSDEDRELLKNGLFIGRATRPSPEVLGRGDFVVRGVVGFVQESGAILVADQIAEGELIQFHLRDQDIAQEDLEMVLIPQLFMEQPSGALLFTCIGRGTRMYDHPNGDIRIIQRNLGSIPLAGFFSTGEISPSGGRNYIHGGTANLVLFRPRIEPSTVL